VYGCMGVWVYRCVDIWQTFHSDHPNLINHRNSRFLLVTVTVSGVGVGCVGV